MPGSRESSVWRALAVAFGDGLAFGVGLTLTNNAARAASKRTQPAHPDLHSLADRLAQIEERIDRGRFSGALPAGGVNTQQISRVAEAVVSAMDTRFGELEQQSEQRLGDVEARLRRELAQLEASTSAQSQSADAEVERRFDALRAELNASLEAQRIRVDGDVRVLRSQMLQVHKEFAETLARLVDEQIEHTISVRLQAIQEQTHETVRQETRAAHAAFAAEMEKRVEARLEENRAAQATLQAELERHVGARLEDMRQENLTGQASVVSELERRLGIRLEEMRQSIADQANTTGALERQLAARLEETRQENFAAQATLSAGIEKLIEARLQSLHEERAVAARQVAELRARLDGQEHQLPEMFRSLAQSCLNAADRIGAPAAPPQGMPLSNGGGGSSETYISLDHELPAFARYARMERKWRIPAAGSLLLVTTGLLAVHYLIV